MGLALRFQMVQNAGPRLVMGTDDCQHVTLVLKSLHGLLICYWESFKDLVLVCKALNNLYP